MGQLWFALLVDLYSLPLLFVSPLVIKEKLVIMEVQLPLFRVVLLGLYIAFRLTSI